ncbi:GGDEF domain-containing response regulator, partial [Trichloromonas sp.]|uniref:GGDEF domain-containing response regulator n=1 Tax=Trichloromonas sp. TaxID=3069249 RepID=UPI003D819174
MPGMSGMELLKQIKDLQSEVEVIIMTSQSNLTTSIKALRAGAFDFLPKPIEDLDIISIVAERAFDNFYRVTEKQGLIAELERKNQGMAIANKTLQDMVIRDGLTGRYNHSYFKEAVEIEMVRSQRYQRQFSMLFMDLDHFKQYNDTHGHPAGDQLLKTLGALIGERLRKSDILARYGGEEFTAILPELAKAEALGLAEEIRHEVERFPFPGREYQPEGKVSITIGVAAFPEDGKTPEALINSADQALYRGKKQGRNRVST